VPVAAVFLIHAAEHNGYLFFKFSRTFRHHLAWLYRSQKLLGSIPQPPQLEFPTKLTIRGDSRLYQENKTSLAGRNWPTLPREDGYPQVDLQMSAEDLEGIIKAQEESIFKPRVRYGAQLAEFERQVEKFSSEIESHLPKHRKLLNYRLIRW
jgi:hypothetical protein